MLTTGVELISRQVLVITVMCVMFTESRMEGDQWPVAVQVHRSHYVASDMLVKCTSRASAAV